jgi:hypothetical protein
VLHFALTETNQTVRVYGSCLWDAAGNVNCGSGNPVSIIDGQNQRVPVLITGTSTSIFTFNHFQVSFGNGTDIETGFCSSYYGGTEIGCGGGIRVGTLQTLRLNDNRISFNAASSKTTTSDVSIGGGVYVSQVDEVTLEGNRIHDNIAADQGVGIGGGVYIYGAESVWISNNTFTGNEVSSNNSDGGGGAVVVEAAEGVYISGNTFTSNNAAYNRLIYGGAMYLHNNTGPIYLYQNVFSQNKGATSLQIVHNDLTNPVNIYQNKFWNSGALTAFRMFGDFKLDMYNNIFAPFLTTRGSGRSAVLINISLIGAGVLQPRAEANLRFNTIAYADRGLSVGNNIDLTLKDNIIAETTSSGVLIYGTSVISDIANNLYYGNIGGNGETGTVYHIGDPIFIDPDNGDLHIGYGSAAIGQAEYDGDYPEDYDGQLRQHVPSDTRADLGADEMYGFRFLPLILK